MEKLKTISRRDFLIGAALGLVSTALPVRAQSKVVLKLGHQYAVDHPVSKGAQKAAQLVSSASGGRIELQLFPAAQLGSAKELIQQVSEGSLDFGIDGPGVVSNWYRPLGVFDLPFLARDWSQMARMIASPWTRKQFEALSESRNIQVFGRPWYYGARHFTTRNRELRTARDAQGLKLRVPEVPVFLDMIRALGATPTPMALGEVYLSLQTGVVDGQENPLATIDTQKFYEVQGCLNMTAHIINPMLMMVSTKRWTSLSIADREIITDAFDKGGEVSDALMNDLESKLVDQFRKAGMKIIESDKKSFQAAMQGIYQARASVWGEATVPALQAL